MTRSSVPTLQGRLLQPLAPQPASDGDGLLRRLAGDRQQLVDEDELSRVGALGIHRAGLLERFAQLGLGLDELRLEIVSFLRHASLPQRSMGEWQSACRGLGRAGVEEREWKSGSDQARSD